MIPNIVAEDFFKRIVSAVPKEIRPFNVSYSPDLEEIGKVRDKLGEVPFKQGKFWSFLIWNREALDRTSEINRPHRVRLDNIESLDEPAIQRKFRQAQYVVNAKYVCNSMLGASMFEAYLWVEPEIFGCDGLTVEAELLNFQGCKRDITLGYAIDPETLVVSGVEHIADGRSSLWSVTFNLRITTSIFSPNEICLPKIGSLEVETFIVSSIPEGSDALIEILQLELSQQPDPTS